MATASLIACAVLALGNSLLAQVSAVPLSAESKHHRVFENQFVRVFDVTVPAHDSTLYHVHPYDYAYVTFGDVSLLAQPLGGAQSPLDLKNGEVRFTAAPISHRVVNPSSVPFHNLTIEVLKPSGVPLSEIPAGGVVLDNALVRAERVVLEPRQSTARHEHRGPWLDVAVSSGSLLETDDDGHTSRATYHPASYHWNATGRAHVLTNTGTSPMELIEIEWK